MSAIHLAILIALLAIVITLIGIIHWLLDEIDRRDVRSRWEKP